MSCTASVMVSPLGNGSGLVDRGGFVDHTVIPLGFCSFCRYLKCAVLKFGCVRRLGGRLVISPLIVSRQKLLGWVGTAVA